MEKKHKVKTVLDFAESLLGNTTIWYAKDDDDHITVHIDLLDRGITISMSHWEYENFVQNIAMGSFKLSQMRHSELKSI
tara:strand:- start:578 stop:814 length:237 start_codon:yes stop_codon:yes gene_type:complete